MFCHDHLPKQLNEIGKNIWGGHVCYLGCHFVNSSYQSKQAFALISALSLGHTFGMCPCVMTSRIGSLCQDLLPQWGLIISHCSNSSPGWSAMTLASWSFLGTFFMSLTVMWFKGQHIPSVCLANLSCSQYYCHPTCTANEVGVPASAQKPRHSGLWVQREGMQMRKQLYPLAPTDALIYPFACQVSTLLGNRARLLLTFLEPNKSQNLNPTYSSVNSLSGLLLYIWIIWGGLHERLTTKQLKQQG